MRLIVLIAVLSVAAPVVSAHGSLESQRSELQRNQALWKAQGLRDYRFRLRVRCFCPDSDRAVTVTVRNGTAHGAMSFQRQLDTIPEMFKMIRHALDDPKAGKVIVRYDARRGFPRSASIDRIKLAIDDEIAWTADRFRALHR